MPHNRQISVIGLGLVGLAIALAFGRVGKVIGFDINKERIKELKNGIDKNEEFSKKDIKSTKLKFTSNPVDIKKANFHIIAVPTPLNRTNGPDLSMLFNASEIVGRQLKKDDIVVYESTVYPGATEEQCIPVLENTSKLKYRKDFGVGFSPERINPADKEHGFDNITKIISATDKKTLNILSEVYRSVVKAGVFEVSNIRVAEAAKIIENTQRDVNIAFMNDITILLHKLNIDSYEVFSAMKTKWNALDFEPGLVGGHCIGVNSYYLTHKADEIGFYSDLITASRQINESIAKFIVNETIKKLLEHDIPIKKAKIAVLGFTYKKDCPDLHDTKVIDIVRNLQSHGIDVLVHDPIADSKIAQEVYRISLKPWSFLKNLDALIIAVAHKQYIKMPSDEYIKILNKPGLIIDVIEKLNPKDFHHSQIVLWRL